MSDENDAFEWGEISHEFVGVKGGPCDRCGVTRTKAIHSFGMARDNGWDYVDADMALHVFAKPVGGAGESDQ